LVYLCPPGDAGLYAVAHQVVRQCLGKPQPKRLHIVARTNEGQFPRENVQELREFVERNAAQERAHTRDVILVLPFPHPFVYVAHAPKLIGSYECAARTKALLLYEQGSRSFKTQRKP